MALADLKPRQIDLMIQRFREKGVTTNGVYTLAELVTEQKRRSPSPFPPAAVAKEIVRQSKASPNGRTTYLKLWQAFNPGAKWKGNFHQKQISNALAQVIAYCVDHNLPILTTVVVDSSGKHKSSAVQNIFNESRELGIQTGTDPLAFIDQQAKLTLELVETALPDSE